MQEKIKKIVSGAGKIVSAGELREFENALYEKPVTSIRLHPLKKNTAELPSAVPWCEAGRYLSERPVFTLDPLLHAGTYYVQEASSQFLHYVLSHALEKNNTYNVLDLCAAPGGKTTLVSSLLPPGSLLVANEVIRSRMPALKENVIKWGLTNTVITGNAPRDFSALRHFFDVVIADVPCSGEGLIRKDKNAIDGWSEKNVETCAARQKNIISDVWDTLKPGGLFIYSTCTFNTRENEDTVSWISAEKSVENLPLEVPDSWKIVLTQSGGVTGYRFFPHRVKGEGFFMAVMLKTGDEKPQASPKIKKKTLFHARQNEIQAIYPWIKNPDEKIFVSMNNTTGVIDRVLSEQVEILRQYLHSTYDYLPVTIQKGKDFIPQHELALSVCCNHSAFPVLNLSCGEALKFLRKEELKSTVDDGWHLILYSGNCLGWVKKTNGRMNNYYPTGWRILMRI